MDGGTWEPSSVAAKETTTSFEERAEVGGDAFKKRPTAASSAKERIAVGRKVRKGCLLCSCRCFVPNLWKENQCRHCMHIISYHVLASTDTAEGSEPQKPIYYTYSSRSRPARPALSSDSLYAVDTVQQEEASPRSVSASLEATVSTKWPALPSKENEARSSLEKASPRGTASPSTSPRSVPSLLSASGPLSLSPRSSRRSAVSEQAQPTKLKALDAAVQNHHTPAPEDAASTSDSSDPSTSKKGSTISYTDEEESCNGDPGHIPAFGEDQHPTQEKRADQQLELRIDMATKEIERLKEEVQRLNEAVEGARQREVEWERERAAFLAERAEAASMIASLKHQLRAIRRQSVRDREAWQAQASGLMMQLGGLLDDLSPRGHHAALPTALAVVGTATASSAAHSLPNGEPGVDRNDALVDQSGAPSEGDGIILPHQRRNLGVRPSGSPRFPSRSAVRGRGGSSIGAPSSLTREATTNKSTRPPTSTDPASSPVRRRLNSPRRRTTSGFSEWKVTMEATLTAHHLPNGAEDASLIPIHELSATRIETDPDSRRMSVRQTITENSYVARETVSPAITPRSRQGAEREEQTPASLENSDIEPAPSSPRLAPPEPQAPVQKKGSIISGIHIPALPLPSPGEDKHDLPALLPPSPPSTPSSASSRSRPSSPTTPPPLSSPIASAVPESPKKLPEEAPKSKRSSMRWLGSLLSPRSSAASSDASSSSKPSSPLASPSTRRSTAPPAIRSEGKEDPQQMESSGEGKHKGKGKAAKRSGLAMSMKEGDAIIMQSSGEAAEKKKERKKKEKKEKSKKERKDSTSLPKTPEVSEGPVSIETKQSKKKQKKDKDKEEEKKEKEKESTKKLKKKSKKTEETSSKKKKKTRSRTLSTETEPVMALSEKKSDKKHSRKRSKGKMTLSGTHPPLAMNSST